MKTISLFVVIGLSLGNFTQRSAYLSSSNVHEKSADTDEHPYMACSILTRDRKQKVGLGICVEGCFLAPKKSGWKLGFSDF